MEIFSLLASFRKKYKIKNILKSIKFMVKRILVVSYLTTIFIFSIFGFVLNPSLPPTEHAKTSTMAFFHLHHDDKLLTVAERLISIPILGSLYISLRRKLERRVRH